jgi:restriction endonuclease S subunit
MIYTNKFKLGEIISSISFGKRPASDKMESGKFPFITIEQDGDYFTDTKDFSGDTILIQTAKHSKEVIPVVKFQTGDFGLAQNIMAVTFDPTMCDQRFMYFFILNVIEDINNTCFLNDANLNTQRFKNFEVNNIPSIEKQKEIVRILEAINKSKEMASRGLLLSDELFESSIHHSFDTGSNSSIFLKDILENSNLGSTSDSSEFPVHSIQKNGLFTIKKETAGKNAEKYKRAKVNDLIYRPAGILESYINLVSEDSLVPTIYNLMKINDDLVDKNFLIHYLRSRHFLEILSSKVSLGVRTNLSSKDFLNIQISELPSLDEQKKLSSFLDNLLEYRNTWKKEEIYYTELLNSTMRSLIYV